ncbi:hypothetical protein FRC03_002746 [Tulasnella sp. 419]|nr:hypothetical protein FRC02_000076 [Tulasnella sp. 418]KAG8969470.1 hypothetical protein FRC03_002746 [Tulasnella sp. 419]
MTDHHHHPYRLARVLRKLIDIRKSDKSKKEIIDTPMTEDQVMETQELETPTKAAHTRSLADILDEQGSNTPDTVENTATDANNEEEDDEPETVAQEGFCIECEDQAAEIFCETCADAYCEICFHSQHRKGTRKTHTSRSFKSSGAALQPTSTTDKTLKSTLATDGGDTSMDVEATPKPADEPGTEPQSEGSNTAVSSLSPTPAASTPTLASPSTSSLPTIGAPVGEWFVERSKFIPLRLTPDERKLLRLLEGALAVSEYTNKIDIITFASSKPRRIVQQIKEICAILSGLLLAADYNLGQQLFSDRNFEANASFYQHIFEIGRRHKIQNPDRMRESYGKLMYLLMDAQNPEVQDLLGFSLVDPEKPTVRTVYDVLQELDCVDILRDNLVSVATREIISDGDLGVKRSRIEIQREIKSKEKAVEILVNKYALDVNLAATRGGRSTRSSGYRPRSDGGAKAELVRQCLYSIGDNHAFLRVNRDPCDKMIAYLKKYFHPTNPDPSLAIRSGRGGARLSHSHEKQYAYVHQSLTLWREILHDMFKLWSLAEQDLLSPHATYRLRDTGQGLQRVQHCPKTSRIMHQILHRAQQNIGSWVGSSVIHLGDTAVPNALMFIDKYSQIYRILLPVTNVLSQIPTLVANQKSAVKTYIDNEFGGTEELIKEILTDMFRHAFDGSGADNNFDAGSCIDGRLTSAWNWCSNLEKKRYFPIFLLTGFSGFDGEW